MNIQQNRSEKLGDFLANRSLSIKPDLEIYCAVDEAVSFLKKLDPSGRHNIVRIEIDRTGNVKHAPRGRTFEPGQWDAIRAYLADGYGRENYYFSLNEPRPNSPNGKLSKADISQVRALCVDVDPDDGVELEPSRERIRQYFINAADSDFPPTAVWDSGGGFQACWLIDGKVPVTPEIASEIESFGRGLACQYDGDRVQNIDRIFRLPGMLNVPDANKRARGRIERPAKLLHFNGPTYGMGQIRELAPVASPGSVASDLDPRVAQTMAEIDLAQASECSTFEALPVNLRNRFAVACDKNPQLQSIWDGDPNHVKGAKSGSTSEWHFALAYQIQRVRQPEFSVTEFAQLLHVWPQISEFWDKYDDDQLCRQIARDWVKTTPTVDAAENAIKWFDYDIAAQQSEQLFPAAPRNANSQYFEVVSVEELETRPPAQWLIGRHIPKQSVGFLAGTPGAGKTFLAIDIGLSVAYGLPDWHGDNISNEDDGVVVYVSGEGGYALSARISAWRTHHSKKTPTDRFWLIEQPVNMTRAEDIEKLEKTLSERLKKPVAAIFIDTLSRVIPGADENNQADMSRFIHACDKLKLRFRCAVVCIHHMNSGGAHMRGSTTLAGGADFIFTLSKFGNGKARKLECAKMKDGPDDWKDLYSFETQPTTSDQVSLVPIRISGNSENNGGLTPSKSERIFDAINQAANDGRPWALSKQSKQRCASLRMQEDFQMDREEAEEALQLWINSGIIAEVMVNPKKKLRGLQTTQRQSHAAETNDAFN